MIKPSQELDFFPDWFLSRDSFLKGAVIFLFFFIYTPMPYHLRQVNRNQWKQSEQLHILLPAKVRAQLKE